MSKLQGPSKLRLIQIPIADDVLTEIDKGIQLTTPGLPINTTEGAIGDALFLYYSQEINDFLRAYINNQSRFYPKQIKAPFSLGVSDEQ
jgi:hypothetical protein